MFASTIVLKIGQMPQWSCSIRISREQLHKILFSKMLSHCAPSLTRKFIQGLSRGPKVMCRLGSVFVAIVFFRALGHVYTIYILRTVSDNKQRIVVNLSVHNYPLNMQKHAVRNKFPDSELYLAGSR